MTLVALCFTAVLGISLAGYIAVCSRAMQLSNRTFQTGLSAQLAEMGLSEGLRAFNKNLLSGTDTTAALADWSTGGVTADWTLDTTNKRATATIAFPATKFGQGVTGSVKIRVDNYDVAQLGSTWSSSATYRIGDLVGRNGICYRSVRNNNTNQTPSTTNMTWWVTNPMPWTWRTSASYLQYEMVNYAGIWYSCIAAHTSNATTFSTDAANWNAIPTQRVWASSTPYSLYDVVSYPDPTTGDVGLYRCTTAHTSSASFSTDAANWSSNVQTVSLAWSSGTVYTRGAMVYYVGASLYRWYYCIQSGTSSTIPSSDTTMWAPVWNDTGFTAVDPGDTVVAGTKYYMGDYANYSGLWYRCTNAHIYNSWAADSGNWTSINALPYLQLFYFGPGSLSTTSNSIFYYAGSNWYRYMGGYVLALTGNMHAWVSGYKYNPGDAVYYSSRWYRCLVAHTSSGSIVPTSTVYWATDPLYSTTWDSRRQYNQNDTVRYSGVWYRYINGTPTNGNVPTDTAYWIGANTSTASDQWNPATAYSPGDYKSYGGVWYKCISATTANAGHSPNNTTYWTAAWTNSFGVTTGAPVVYAEGTVNIAGSPSIVTQLRATLAQSPLFPNAAAANSSTITANSGGTVDSYDSTLGTYASQTSSATTNHSAVLASNYSAGTAITLSSTDVKGYLAAPSSSSSPYAPLYSSGGTVKGYTSPVSPTIDPTRISRSPYIPQFDTLPAGGLAANWATTPKGTALALSATINIGTPGDTTPSRYYYNGDLTIDGSTVTTMNINGPVILYINGHLRLDNTASNLITINSTGSAEIHIASRLRVDANGGGFNNLTRDPKKLILICDTSSTSGQYYSDGSNAFYGVIYMPNTTNSNGLLVDNSTVQIYGAVSAKKITYSGADMNIHYDTSLRSATFGGVDQPYAITEWRELTDPAERATMP